MTQPDKRNGRRREDDRGQAFTLEAVVGGLLMLAAFLFALQSTVITPTTTSAVDPEVRQDLRQQAEDVMAIVQENDSTDLSFYVRFWDPNRGTFAGEGVVNPTVGYGTNGPPGLFGNLLRGTFSDRSRSYNVEILYLAKNRDAGREKLVLTNQGTPTEGAVVASRTVVLYDNQSLTSPFVGATELWEYNTSGSRPTYPVPDAVDGPVYNVVEVRLIVW